MVPPTRRMVRHTVLAEVPYSFAKPSTVAPSSYFLRIPRAWLSLNFGTFRVTIGPLILGLGKNKNLESGLGILGVGSVLLGLRGGLSRGLLGDLLLDLLRDVLRAVELGDDDRLQLVVRDDAHQHDRCGSGRGGGGLHDLLAEAVGRVRV